MCKEKVHLVSILYKPLEKKSIQIDVKHRQENQINLLAVFILVFYTLNSTTSKGVKLTKVKTQARVLSLPYLLVNLGYLKCRVATGFTKPCLVFASGLFMETISSCPSIMKHVRHYDFERRYDKTILFPIDELSVVAT